ncbi:hypothetical protein ASZ78_005033 [Callipepla squamata]|uniref:E3 ubiquitin-protein ligase CHFR n=1 Tax=Callipepla squamata TaxID=9009 RepID=A0A226NCT5_CALSU|nr:hypothetical protein ASZ78_005033 [Callipepla squamata]
MTVLLLEEAEEGGADLPCGRAGGPAAGTARPRPENREKREAERADRRHVGRGRKSARRLPEETGADGTAEERWELTRCGAGGMAARGASRPVWCLRRVGAGGGWLLLEAGTQVTVGRGLDLTYQLVSKTCPLMISRKHCVFQQNAEGQWTVKDNKSWTGLEKLRKTLIDIKKLKVKVQEKQTAVLNVKQKRRKAAQKTILAMEKELQELQDKLCTEQVQHQQQVEELERTFSKEQQKLEGVKWQDGEENLKEQLAQVLQEANASLCSNMVGTLKIVNRKPNWVAYNNTLIFGMVSLQHHALMEELSRSKKDYEEIIRAKNKELEETKVEKEKVRAQKEEVLNQMNDVLENELQCTICSEHFIEAVTLNCAHSFCSYCIDEWTKRKVECPICRQEIKSKTRSLVLDNCIDRMVENLDVEMKEHRLTLIRERKGERWVYVA